MIRKNFHSFECWKRSFQIPECQKVVFRICQPRYQHVADPHGFSMVCQIMGHGKDIVIGLSRQFLMKLSIHRLNIKQKKIGEIHEPIKFFQIFRIHGKWIAGGIQCCVYLFFFCQAEKFRYKV